MQQDIKSLKRKIDAIATNISIYQHDLKKYKATLQKQFGITDLDEADQLLDDLETDIESLTKKQNILLSRAAKLLKDVKVSNAKLIESNKRHLQKSRS